MAADLSIDPVVALVIVGMALATYLTRVLGFMIMGVVPLTTPVRRFLEALPGAVVMATITPIAAKAGASGLLALVVAVVAMIYLRKEYLAVPLAMAAAAVARAAGL